MAGSRAREPAVRDRARRQRALEPVAAVAPRARQGTSRARVFRRVLPRPCWRSCCRSRRCRCCGGAGARPPAAIAVVVSAAGSRGCARGGRAVERARGVRARGATTRSRFEAIARARRSGGALRSRWRRRSRPPRCLRGAARRRCGRCARRSAPGCCSAPCCIPWWPGWASRDVAALSLPWFALCAPRCSTTVCRRRRRRVGTSTRRSRGDAFEYGALALLALALHARRKPARPTAACASSRRTSGRSAR